MCRALRRNRVIGKMLGQKSERVKFPIYRVVVDWLYTFRV